MFVQTLSTEYLSYKNFTFEIKLNKEHQGIGII